MPLLINQQYRNPRSGLIQPTYENYADPERETTDSLPLSQPFDIAGKDYPDYGLSEMLTRPVHNPESLEYQDQQSQLYPLAMREQQGRDDRAQAEAEQQKLLQPLVLGQGSMLAQGTGRILANNPVPLEPEKPVILKPGERAFQGNQLLAEGGPQQEQTGASAGTWTPLIQNGKLIYFNASTGETREAPAGAQQPATVRDDQVKIDAKKNVAEFIRELRDISKRLITKKRALEQRLSSSGRAVDAALMDDPDYRVYTDMRTGLAGAMAVAEQGARSVSDTDIEAVYGPMIPDIFRDTEKSAPQKWNIIEKRFTGGSSISPTAASTQNRPQTLTTPDGKTYTLQPDGTYK